MKDSKKGQRQFKPLGLFPKRFLIVLFSYYFI